MNSMYSGELSYAEFDSLFETPAKTAVKKDVMNLLKGYIKTKIKASATKTDASHVATIVPRFMNKLPITFTGTDSTHRGNVQTLDNFKRPLDLACDTKNKYADIEFGINQLHFMP